MVTSDYHYHHITNMAIYKTLDLNFTPGNISMDDVTHKYEANKDDPKLLDLEIFWKPAAGTMIAII